MLSAFYSICMSNFLDIQSDESHSATKLGLFATAKKSHSTARLNNMCKKSDRDLLFKARPHSPHDLNSFVSRPSVVF